MKYLACTLSLGALLFASCSDSTDEASSAAPPSPPASAADTPPPAASTSQQIGIFVSNYPLSYFVSRLAGDSVAMLLPSTAGDPAFWQPKPEHIPILQNTGVLFFNGAGYEKWANAATLPQDRIVDTSKAFADKYITIPDTVTHSHGPSGDHSHQGTAFTTWIDFTQASQQAQAVNNALTQIGLISPQQAEAAFAQLNADLLALDNDLKKITANNNGLPLLASHPVYDYLGRQYQLNLNSVLWEPSVAPNDNEWAALQEALKTHPAKWMIWESQPLPETVTRLQALGINSVVFDPCSNRPAQGDFLSTMRQNVENMKPVFASQ
jgi:zinc transport system substrate-binding protein